MRHGKGGLRRRLRARGLAEGEDQGEERGAGQDGAGRVRIFPLPALGLEVLRHLAPVGACHVDGEAEKPKQRLGRDKAEQGERRQAKAPAVVAQEQSLQRGGGQRGDDEAAEQGPAPIDLLQQHVLIGGQADLVGKLAEVGTGRHQAESDQQQGCGANEGKAGSTRRHGAGFGCREGLGRQRKAPLRLGANGAVSSFRVVPSHAGLNLRGIGLAKVSDCRRLDQLRSVRSSFNCASRCPRVPRGRFDCQVASCSLRWLLIRVATVLKTQGTDARLPRNIASKSAATVTI